MTTLRYWERQGQGRLPEPSAGCVDSQSIKTATQGIDVGFKEIVSMTTPSASTLQGAPVFGFVQIAAAFRDRGFHAIDQSDFLTSSGKRFVVDIDRGARIRFRDQQGQQIHLRYNHTSFLSIRQYSKMKRPIAADTARHLGRQIC
jgi:hypothetical protein